MIRFRLARPLAVAILATLAAPVALTLDAGTAHAVDTVTSKDAPDLTSVRAKIAAKDFAGAVTELRKIADTTQHADVYNLLAFSLRNTGDYAQARTFYAKALDFDPNHLGAHEYLGELYVKTGELDKAKAMLIKLDGLCPNGCEERADLQKAIASAGTGDGAGAATKTN